MADLESSAKAEVSLSTHWTNKAREAKVVVNKWSATVLAEPSTPYQEHKTPKCCTFCRIASICLSIVFGWIVVFTFLKIPYMPSQKYYTNATYNLTEHPECYEPWNHPECYGPQGNVNVMAWESNFQGVQLVTDYSLFIGPHTVMSIALECLFIAFLVRGWSSAVPLGDAIVPLAALFALHVAPVGYGMPSLYLNWACILIIWSGCVIARWGRETIRNPSKANEEDEVRLGNKMLFVGLVMIICAVNTAPFAEFAFLAGTRVLNETTGETAGAAWAQTREDHPLAASGHGVYAGCQCPGFGWIVTFGLLGYLILTGAIYVYRWSSLSREGCIADLEKSAPIACMVARRCPCGLPMRSPLRVPCDCPSQPRDRPPRECRRARPVGRRVRRNYQHGQQKAWRPGLVQVREVLLPVPTARALGSHQPRLGTVPARTLHRRQGRARNLPTGRHDEGHHQA